MSLSVPPTTATIEYAVHHRLVESMCKRPLRNSLPARIKRVLGALEIVGIEILHFDQIDFDEGSGLQMREKINQIIFDIIDVVDWYIVCNNYDNRKV